MRSGLGSRAVFADDLTGAMDAGLQLYNKGLSISVRFDANEVFHNKTDIFIFDSESRQIEPEAAYKIVFEAAVILRRGGIQLLYKKVDSTLRGNISSETRAILDSEICNSVLFAPALPHFKRYTREGYHFINQTPIAETAIGRDLIAPVVESNIPLLLKQHSDVSVGILTLQDLRSEGCVSILKRLWKQNRIVVADSEGTEDLTKIAALVDVEKNEVLASGSAGLLEHLQIQNPPEGNAITKKEDRAGPVLAVCGSNADIVFQQVAESTDTEVVYLFKETSTGHFVLKNLAEIVAQTEWAVKNHRNTILFGPAISKSSVSALTDEKKTEPWKVKSILSRLTETTRRILNRFTLNGLILTGGETAFEVLKSLGAYGMDITGEVEPFVPEGTIVGGMAHDLPAVTKAGGFGDKNTLRRAIAYMQNL